MRTIINSGCVRTEISDARYNKLKVQEGGWGIITTGHVRSKYGISISELYETAINSSTV